MSAVVRKIPVPTIEPIVSSVASRVVSRRSSSPVPLSSATLGPPTASALRRESRAH
jgi:hypothetical protein